MQNDDGEAQQRGQDCFDAWRSPANAKLEKVKSIPPPQSTVEAEDASGSSVGSSPTARR